MTPETAEIRPPRNGPTLRQTSAESRSGLMGVAATEMAAAVRATSARARFVCIAVEDGTRWAGVSNMYLRPFASLDLPSTAPLDEEMRAGFRSVALDLAVMFVPPEVVVIPAIFIVVGAVTITRMAFRHHEKMAELQRGGGDGGGTRDPE